MIVTKMKEFQVDENVVVNSVSDLVPLLVEFYNNSSVENFVVIALGGGKQVISIRTITVGTVNRTLVHPREVFRYAILENAASIIISHNHPSGFVSPSSDDINITKILKEASEIIGITLLDHVIIGKGNYFSFLENDCF